MDQTTRFDRTLPRKRMGAGCLFFNEDGHLLLVNPTYKPQWEIPGGIVEANESPRDTCTREIKEELGLDFRPMQMLAVDYLAETDERTEALMFIFGGKELSAPEISSISLPADELSEFRFVSRDELIQLTKPRLHRRVLACWDLYLAGRCAYLENGSNR